VRPMQLAFRYPAVSIMNWVRVCHSLESFIVSGSQFFTNRSCAYIFCLDGADLRLISAEVQALSRHGLAAALRFADWEQEQEVAKLSQPVALTAEARHGSAQDGTDRTEVIGRIVV
jgi:hypothetical protein